MTSQVAVYNSLGVGIASDTVVTHWSGGGTIKTLQNAEKIVPLGQPHSLAVMISGNVHQNDVNLRLLVSEWAHQSSVAKTVSDYANDFTIWIQNPSNRYLDSESDSKNALNLIRNRFRRIRSEVNSFIKENTASPKEIYSYRVRRNLEKLTAAELFSGISDTTAERSLGHLGVSLEDIFTHYLGGFAGFDVKDPQLRQIATLQLSRFTQSSDDSVLGFVGFGSEDLYACDVKVYFRGRVGGISLTRIGKPFGGGGAFGHGGIHTFAQDNAIQGFLRGIYPEMSEMLRSSLWRKLNVNPSVALQEKELRSLIKEVVSELENYQQENLISPLLTTISGLNLKGLAELAGALVGMQASRSAGSSEPASVGGFIETATISRREGYIWVNKLP